MANLKNQPLVYSLGQIRFPRVPDIRPFRNSFLEIVRSRFPVDREEDVTSVDVGFGAEGLKVDKFVITLLKFSSPDLNDAIILANDMLCFSTVNYRGHQQFLADLGFAIDGLLQLPNFSRPLVRSAGVRFIDLVEPREGIDLSQFLEPWALPTVGHPVAAGAELTRALHSLDFATGESGRMRIRIMLNPAAILPPDIEPLVQNDWKRKRPDGSFVVVDYDHSTLYTPLIPLEKQRIMNDVASGRAIAKEAFEKASTPLALRVWNGEQP